MTSDKLTVAGEATDTSPNPDLLKRASEAVQMAVRAGQLAPTFRLQGAGGETYSLLVLIEKAPLLITFYRGLWCDYCQARLESLAELYPQIRALAAQQVVIGPAARNDAEMAWLAALPMPVLLDRDLRITAAYGMSIDLPEDLHGRYTGLGYLPVANDRWVVPVPGTLLVEPTGRVAMAAADADYRSQVAAADLLAALRGLQKRRLSAIAQHPINPESPGESDASQASLGT